MWFSPLKGAHLTLGQLDKTLPVDVTVEANKSIERGSFVYIKADENDTAISPRFALYTAEQATSPNAVPYIALQSVKDFQAGMAGNIGQAEIANGVDTETAATGANLDFIHAVAKDSDKPFAEQDIKGPRITGISVLQAAEYQTTAFEPVAAGGTPYYVGQPLTINNGKLAPFTTGKNIVGYVTAVPFKRWINDLGASVDGARISGGNAFVINFSTAWVPAAGSPTPGPTKAKVTFNSEGGTAVPQQEVEIGQKASQPTAPTKDGKVFAGWYKEAELTNQFDFNTAITADITLYAKWADAANANVRAGAQAAGAPAGKGPAAGQPAK